MPSKAAVARAFLYESLDAGHARTIREVASRIIGRERAIAEGKAAYLLNGLDLIAVKVLLPHGQFESWCKAELRYSKSTAERLMQTAQLFGHMVENVNLTDLPRQPVARLLADPQTPDDVRSLYVARIDAGERPSTGEIREAIERARGVEPEPEPAESATSGRQLTPIEPPTDEPDAGSETVQADPMTPERAARRATIMTVRLMGHEMGRFQRLVALAGPEYIRHITGIRLRADDVTDAEWSDPPEPDPEPGADLSDIHAQELEREPVEGDPFTGDDDEPPADELYDDDEPDAQDADDDADGREDGDDGEAIDFEMAAPGVPRLNRHERRRAEKLKRGGWVQ